MAANVRQFLEVVKTHRVVASAHKEEVERLASSHAATADASALAKALVGAGALSKLQAAAIYQGKLADLLLGNYLLIEKLGEGGMGLVYRARHLKMDRVVAIKLLPKRSLNSPEAVQRFQREVQAAARLVHTNIVTAFDADEAHGQHFLAMELVDGRDLAQIVRKDGPVTVAKAIRALQDAAQGLRHAHAQGIVHRDIKPSNLLLDPAGTVKILDMGLARYDAESAPVMGGSSTKPPEDLTQDGSMMGTIDYMAPEQALDTRTADSRADVYALGCTLHFLLVGRSPYQADTVMKRLVAHRDAPIPSLKQSRRDVPNELDGLFRKMLAKRPDDRPSADDVVKSLERIQGGLGKRRASSRNKVYAAFAAGGVAVVGLVVALVMVLGREKPPVAKPASDTAAANASPMQTQAGVPQPPKPAKVPATMLTVATPVIPPAAQASATVQTVVVATATATQTSSKPDTESIEAEVKFFSSGPTPSATATASSPASATVASSSPPVPAPKSTGTAAALIPVPSFNDPPPPAAEPAPPALLPVPDVAAQQAVEPKLREIYGNDLKGATNDAARSALIERLLVDASLPAEQGATRYGLFLLARTLAVDSADTVLIRKTIAACCAVFDDDEDALYLTTLRNVSQKLRDATMAKRFADDGLKRLDDVLAASDFASVDQLLPILVSLQTKSRDPEVNRAIGERRTRLAALRKEFDTAEKAAQTLTTKPDDPAANLIRGKYLCFSRGDWSSGLPLLAKGSDEPLRRLAGKVADLDAAAPAEQLAAGHAWWTESQKAKTNPARYRDLLKGANFWYRIAYPALPEVDRRVLDVRLADVERTIGPVTLVAKPLGADVMIDPNKLPPELVFPLATGVELSLKRAPAGKFTMGSPSDEPTRNTKEFLHEVTISRPLYVGTYEVQFRQWAAIVGDARPEPSAGPTAPIGQVSWFDAIDYCRLLNKALATQARMPGYEFRLPTDAEWEYACRAGTTTATHYGNLIAKEDAAVADSGIKATGSYKPNAWGLFDMHGNVTEWTADWIEWPTTNPGPLIDPRGAASGRERVTRGGSAIHKLTEVRSARRMNSPPNYTDAYLGFRVVYGPAMKPYP